MNANEIGSHKTTISTELLQDAEKRLLVTYHNTIVVKVINDRFVILNTGGWYTDTTKRRMNQASRQYKLGYVVYQSDFTWYVSIGDDIEPYYDGIIIDTKENIISRKDKPTIN